MRENSPWNSWNMESFEDRETWECTLLSKKTMQEQDMREIDSALPNPQAARDQPLTHFFRTLKYIGHLDQ